MEQEIYTLLIKSSLDFLQRHEEAFLKKVAKSWHHSLKKKYNFTRDELDAIYSFGLENKLFTYGFNLQSFYTAIHDWEKMKKLKQDRKIL